MQILTLTQTGQGYKHKWPDGSSESYPSWVEYQAMAEDGKHTVRIAFGSRVVYGDTRVRVLVLIDGYPQAEFFGADDIEYSGEVLSEIKIPGDVGERMCRYMEDPVPVIVYRVLARFLHGR